MFGVVLAFVAVLGSPPTHQEFREFFALEEPTVERLTPQAEMRLLDEIARDIEEREERRLEMLLEKQEALAELGWYEGEVDGIRGPLTERAVERFVAAADLDEAGPAVVLAALSEEDAPEAPPPPPPPSSPVAASPPASAPASGGLTGHRLIIADCESGNRLANGRAQTGSYDWNAINGQGSSASGAFQFIDSTWRWVTGELGYTQYPTARSAPPNVQIEAFDWLWANGGPKHWNPSRSCWGGLL